jgi:hypothetical protein
MSDARIADKPFRALTPDEFRASKTAQERLFEAAQNAVARMKALGHRLLAGAEGHVESERKRENLQEFVDGILEKCKRKNYSRLGEMDDIIRGRIDVDDGDQARRVAAEMEELGTVRTVEDPRVNDAGVVRYPRSHVIVYDPESGLIHEWQIGTRATTTLYETPGITIPERLQAAATALDKKFNNDLHDIEYDIFQVVKKRYPAIAAELGVDAFIAHTAEASERSALGSADHALANDLANLHAEAAAVLTKVVDRIGPVAIASMLH